MSQLWLENLWFENGFWHYMIDSPQLIVPHWVWLTPRAVTLCLYKAMVIWIDSAQPGYFQVQMNCCLFTFPSKNRNTFLQLAGISATHAFNILLSWRLSSLFRWPDFYEKRLTRSLNRSRATLRAPLLFPSDTTLLRLLLLCCCIYIKGRRKKNYPVNGCLWELCWDVFNNTIYIVRISQILYGTSLEFKCLCWVEYYDITEGLGILQTVCACAFTDM